MTVRALLFSILLSFLYLGWAQAEQAYRMTRHELWQAPLSETFGEVFRPPSRLNEPPFSIEDLFHRIWRSGLSADVVVPQLFSLWISAKAPDGLPRWGGQGVGHWARFHLARYGLFPEMTPEEIQNWFLGRSPWLTRSSLPMEYFFGRSIDELPRFRPSNMARVITPHVTLESVFHLLNHPRDGERARRMHQRSRQLYDQEYQPWLSFLGDGSDPAPPDLYGQQVEAKELSSLWHAELKNFVSRRESADVAKARNMGIATVADFARWLSLPAKTTLLVRNHNFSEVAWSEWWRPLRFMGITSTPNRETIAIFTQRFPSCQDQMKNASH